MELTEADVKELRLAREIAQRLVNKAYEARRPRMADPNMFAARVEEDARQIRDLLKRVLGEG